jgi:hypothetical protein
MPRVILPSLVLVSLLAVPARAQRALPLVEGAEWEPLREHCRQVLKGLGGLKAPLPPQTTGALESRLEREPEDPAAAAAAVQKLLDPHCLIGVSINAESRVKAVRGPRDAELRLGRETVVLVKVHNEGGITSALRVSGRQLVAGASKQEGRWLEAAVATEAPFGGKLSGQRLEYRVLRLRPREAGKREATFQFDVGQGTQDLGFRAEVPILFTVRTR